MNTTDVSQIFDALFKFQVNQEVRHKGDSKKWEADMGMLVYARFIIERTDDDGNRTYERSYQCRLVKWSGSGELQHFAEKELMGVKEYEEKKIQDDAERNRMHNEAKQVEAEIYNLFGVNTNTRVYAKDESGVVDTSITYRVSGFSLMEGKCELSCREVLSSLEEVDRKSKKFTDPDQFEVVK